MKQLVNILFVILMTYTFGIAQTVTISPTANPMCPKLLVGGETNVEVARFDLTCTNDAYLLRLVTRNVIPSGAASMKDRFINWRLVRTTGGANDTLNTIAVISHGQVTFSPQFHVLPAGSTQDYSIIVDVNPVDSVAHVAAPYLQMMAHHVGVQDTANPTLGIMPVSFPSGISGTNRIVRGMPLLGEVPPGTWNASHFFMFRHRLMAIGNTVTINNVAFSVTGCAQPAASITITSMNTGNWMHQAGLSTDSTAVTVPWVVQPGTSDIFDWELNGYVPISLGGIPMQRTLRIITLDYTDHFVDGNVLVWGWYFPPFCTDYFGLELIEIYQPG